VCESVCVDGMLLLLLLFGRRNVHFRFRFRCFLLPHFFVACLLGFFLVSFTCCLLIALL